MLHGYIRRVEDVDLQGEMTVRCGTELLRFSSLNTFLITENGVSPCHLEVLWRFKGHKVREELEQEHQRLLTARVGAAATTEPHLERQEKMLLLLCLSL